jgi:hypothetical protein
MGLKDLRAKARFDDSVITTALRPWLKEIIRIWTLVLIVKSKDFKSAQAVNNPPSGGRGALA